MISSKSFLALLSLGLIAVALSGCAAQDGANVPSGSLGGGSEGDVLAEVDSGWIDDSDDVGIGDIVSTESEEVESEVDSTWIGDSDDVSIGDMY